jgi:septal ring factor EnvC (AmiA/AmiB activator)
MSEEDTHRTVESEARGAELRENIALTDARRAEEEVAKAEAEKEAAEQKEEKLSRKERRLREKAERVHAEADRMRAQADADRARAEADAANASTVSGARVASPGVGSATEPDAAAAAAGGTAAPPFPGADKLPEAAQRPEVMVGAAFAGSFIVARILKRIFD